MSIEKTYLNFSNFFNQCINTVVSIMKIIVRSKFGIRLPTTKNESCIILGNGPSLKTSLSKHPEAFLKQPLVCVNGFSLTEEYSTLKPQYYVILDNSFWISESKFVLDTIETLKTKTTWKVQLLIPQIASKSQRFTELCEVNKNIELIYFNYTVFKGFSSIGNFLYNKNLAMPQSQNVLVAAIFLSINIGFKKIIIVGADHTWHQNLHLDETNMLHIKDVHFYENEEKVTYTPFKIAIDQPETHKVHEIFATWAKAFYGYIALEKYANYKNSKIYNASEVSFIDAFERLKL